MLVKPANDLFDQLVSVFFQTVSIVDIEKRVQTSVVPLRYNPEPPHVRSGRRLLYDAVNPAQGGQRISCRTSP